LFTFVTCDFSRQPASQAVKLHFVNITAVDIKTLEAIAPIIMALVGFLQA